MADPVLRLEQTDVSVQPGGQAQVPVSITSTSSIVEGYRLTVLGAEPSRWAEMVPPTVNVYPGEEASAVVVFSPPAGTGATSGRFAFGVKATSTEAAEASAVVEGTVELGAVSGLQAKIVPVTSRGRWRGRHVVRISNWGNATARLRLVATDPDATLGFYLKPDVVELPVGSAATVRLTVRARTPFLRGVATRRPFQVVGEPFGASEGPAPPTPYGDPSRPVVDAALEQRPILTRGFVTVVGLVLALVVAGGVWAWTRPVGAPESLNKLGTPPAPQDLRVVGSDAGSIRLQWRPVDQIDAYTLQHLDPGDRQTVTGVDQVNGSQNSVVVKELPPDAEACFRILAVRAQLVGPPSEIVCGRTAVAPPTASPSGSPSGSVSPTAPASSPVVPPPPPGSPTPPAGSPTSGSPGPVGAGKWVLIVDAFPENDAQAQTKAQAAAQQLVAGGVPNALAASADQYPALVSNNVVAAHAWLTMLGPYDSAAEAAADCTKVQTARPGSFCRTAQPQP